MAHARQPSAAQLSRTGGLAFVVGAGIALAIGSAGSASAAPDSTAASVSDTATTHANARGQHRTAAAKPAVARERRQESAAGTIAATATASSAVRTVPSPQIPASADPAVAAAAAVRRTAEPTRTTEATGTAAAATAPPAASAVGAPCVWQRTITILPKIPPGLPLLTVPWVKKVNGVATFTPKSVYDLHNVDQFDWNKLTGIGFSIPGDVNSSMVAWRYNVASGNFEIAPFFNVDKARILPAQNEIITVPIGETFDFKVNYDGVTISYGDKTVFKPTPQGLTPNFWTSYRVSVWFGGTSLPPNLMKLKIGFTR